MPQISERELLVELGLANLDPASAQRVLTLFVELVELRLGRRLSHLMSASGAHVLENATDLENPRSVERYRKLLEDSVPEYDQFAADELHRTKSDVITRLAERLSSHTSTQLTDEP